MKVNLKMEGNMVMEKNMTKEEILYNGKFEKDKVIKK